MANRLTISGSMNAAIEASETVDGKTYTSFQTDQHVGSLGGSYEATYADDKARKYTGSVASNSGTGTAVSSGGLTGTTTTSGSAPTTIKAFCVRYDNKIGNPGIVYVYISGILHAELAKPGQAVVVPCGSLGIATGKLKVENAYSAGVTEANVTVVSIGD